VTDVNQQEAFIARSYLLRAGAGIGRFYWYQWNSKGGHALQGEPGGDGYTEVAKWIVGNTVAPCKATGSIYSCAVTASGVAELVTWDTSKSCSGATCATAPADVDASFGHYLDLTGASHAIANHSVPLGGKPVLLKP
jgi:hypothetical protein